MAEEYIARDDELDEDEDADIAAPVAEPERFDLLHHADGSPKRMLIRRRDGSGERWIAAEDWPKYGRVEGTPWGVLRTEVVGQNHSDGKDIF